MLRIIVLALLLANAAYFAWAQGLLLSWGMGPAEQSEPQRMGQQVRPEAVRIVTADEARRIESSTAPSVRAPECLLAGPLADSAVEPLRAALASWPNGSWSLEPGVEPARWIIYMGKYINLENLNRKKAELRQLGVSFEPVTNPSLELGLSLGSFASQQAAQVQMERLAERRVRTARVVQERAEVRGQVLRLPAVDDTQRSKLEDLRALLNASQLRACR